MGRPPLSLPRWLIVATSGAAGIAACAEPPTPTAVAAPILPAEAPPTARAGSGVVACSPPAADCNGAADDGCEADLSSDSHHCGACDTACGSAEPCVDGRCAPAASPEPPPYSPDPNGFGDRCGADADCGWDDPCVPTRCMATPGPPNDLVCAESKPAPGRCSCVSSRCMLRPDPLPTPPAEPCERFRCGLDEGAGRCVVGAMLEANQRSLVEGPMCECNKQARCVFSWVDKVPCKSDAQCWVVELPRRHPVRRTSRFMRPFRPCEDAEALPACVEGFCDFGLSYGC